jgi:hypothetical protein
MGWNFQKMKFSRRSSFENKIYDSKMMSHALMKNEIALTGVIFKIEIFSFFLKSLLLFSRHLRENIFTLINLAHAYKNLV